MKRERGPTAAEEVDRVVEEPLDAVGHHDRDLAAGARDEAREREGEDHQRREGRNLPPEDVVGDGQPQEIHEEARADRREDGVVENAVERLDERGRGAEAAAVAHLEELAHRHRPRLPEPVVAEAGEPQEHADGGDDRAPEAVGEAAVVVGKH